MAILLVLFAVLISALRLFLPYAHNYRQDVQNYINDQFNSHVVIGSLNMGWSKQGPSLVTENVSLLDSDAVEIFIEKIDVSFDFWQSLSERRLITKDFTLSGAKVLLESLDNPPDSDEFAMDPITDLFFERIGQFTLRNSQLIIKTNNTEKTFLISQLDWLNEGDRHRAKGDVIVDGLTSNYLKVILDVTGNDFSDISGQLYLKANQLNITPWLDKLFVIENDKTHSEINFDAWLNIEKGIAQQLELVLGDNEISWQEESGPQVITLSAGGFVASNFAKFTQFSLHTTPLEIVINGQPWQPITLQLRKNENTFFSYVSSIELNYLDDLFPLFSDNSETKKLLENLAVTGKLNDVYFQKSAGDITATALIADLSSQFSQGIPGIKYLNGDVYLENNQVQVNLIAEKGALDFDKHFILPIPYNRLKTSLAIEFDEQSWQLQANNIELLSDEISLVADIAVYSPNDGLTEMSLLANVTDGDAKLAQHFYPHLLMGDDLVRYLNNALVDGKIAQAQVLFNGPLALFPFEDHSGIFVVDAELTDSKFKFDSDWPVIKNFNANLNFTNNSMIITGRSGTLEGIDVNGVVAGIADLSDEQILTVDTQIKNTSPVLVTKLMNNSPMADTVGNVLEQVIISKPINGAFSLNLPLNDLDKVIAQGNVIFADNDVNLQTPHMAFNKVNGELIYVNDVITVNGLSAKWLNLPLTLDVDAKDNQYFYGTNIGISADWKEDVWLAKVPDLLKKYGQGMLQWQGDLALNMTHKGDFSYELLIHSFLEKVKLNLPEPYAKDLHQAQTLNVHVIGQHESSIINATLGEQLSFYGDLNHDKVNFTRSHLILGNEIMLLPIEGFHITSELAQADFSQWQPFILDIIDTVNMGNDRLIDDSLATNVVHSDLNQPSSSFSLLKAPERIQGTVAAFDLFGQRLNNVSFNLKDEQSWWLLQLNAKEARSDIKFYPNWYTQGIDISADFIHLTNEHSEGEESEKLLNELLNNEVVFAKIPPVRFQCGHCSIDLYDFGEVRFDINHDQADLIKLQGFSAKRKNTELTFDGQWQHSKDVSLTKIEGKLFAKDIEQEIEKLGYESTIKDSGIKTSFSANWQGGPQNFALAKLNGDISAKFDDGYLDDVKDKARIFSILSLQSLVRKLTLDFRDIFSKGMFYDEIKGDFKIKNGVMYTQNTMMEGATGEVTIKGNIDLAQKLLDYRISFKPNLTSSLPVLAWIATLNPVTFLAGVAIDQVITSKVVSEFTFEVTGSVEEPLLREVNRKSENISVGRSTPPRIVENKPLDDEQSLVDPLKERAHKEQFKPGIIDG
ncbi:MAG: hypothetical protein ACI9LM_000452 [Alteromonadaceae bacterium]|jgi:uncharacterized protein (TIGR02099 family)